MADQLPGEPDKPHVVVIRDEESAWAMLQAAVGLGEEAIPDNLLLKFEGWPRYKVHIDGRDWHGSVPTRIMPAILDLQKDLHRVYAEVRYGEPNIRRLTAEEREQLEIVVEVGDGSSDFQAALESLFSAIAKAAFAKMTPEMIVITVLGSAAILGTTVIGKAWIAKRQRDKELETQVEMSKQETQKLEVMTRAVQQKPYLEEVKSYVEDHTNRVLRTLQPADSASLMGTQLSGSEGAAIAAEARASSEDVHLDGLFRVFLINTEQARLTRVKLSRDSDQLEFMADLPTELSHAEQQLIFDAARDRSLLSLQVTATKRRGNISEAIVSSARAAPKLPTAQGS